MAREEKRRPGAVTEDPDGVKEEETVNNMGRFGQIRRDEDWTMATGFQVMEVTGDFREGHFHGKVIRKQGVRTLRVTRDGDSLCC